MKVRNASVVAASPEPDVNSSLVDFGNFVGVEPETATSTPSVPTNLSADLVRVDGNTATSCANKVATKDDIMALYGPANHSAFYTVPGNLIPRQYIVLL